MLTAIDEAAKLVKREARIVPGSVKVDEQLDAPTSQHNCTAGQSNLPCTLTLVSHSVPSGPSLTTINDPQALI